MRAHTKIAAVALLAVIGVLALVFRGKLPESRQPAPGEARRAQRLAWPDGKRFTYAVSWRGRTGGEVAPGPDGKASQVLTMDASLDGELALERASARGGHTVVALAWTRVDKVSFSMQGHETGGDAAQVQAALAGQTAFLDVDEHGQIHDIGFPADMPPASRSTLRSVALELGYTLPEAESAEWDAVERDSLGDIQVHYRAAGAELLRQPVVYRQLDAARGQLDGKQELSGGAVIALDDSGVPVSIDEAVKVVYTRPKGTAPAVQSQWSFKLRRTGEARGTAGLAAAAARAQVQPLRARVADPDREKRRDQHLAEKMSLDQMMLAFERFERGTRAGGQFVIKAAAWLRLHPEQLPLLAKRFQDSDLTVKGRGLILDVLAQTGTPAAQGAMREALGSEAAHAKPRDFSLLAQRFSFVLAPDRASIEFLEKEYEAANRSAVVQAAQGTAVALGAVVRRLDAQKDHALADQVSEKLRADLRQAQTPELRGALVAALGNAARREAVPDLVAVASDADVRVRDQVASALRSVDSPEARAGLLSLVADSSGAVATSALGSLRKQSLQDDDWRALRDLATSGRTPASSDTAMVELVRAKGQGRAEGRQILGKLLERNDSPDNDLPVIIRSLLDAKKGS
jgi:hypothetical protein